MKKNKNKKWDDAIEDIEDDYLPVPGFKPKQREEDDELITYFLMIIFLFRVLNQTKKKRMSYILIFLSIRNKASYHLYKLKMVRMHVISLTK